MPSTEELFDRYKEHVKSWAYHHGFFVEEFDSGLSVFRTQADHDAYKRTRNAPNTTIRFTLDFTMDVLTLRYETPTTLVTLRKKHSVYEMSECVVHWDGKWRLKPHFAVTFGQFEETFELMLGRFKLA